MKIINNLFSIKCQEPYPTWTIWYLLCASIRFICRFIRYLERCTEETHQIFREIYPHVSLPANRQSVSSSSFSRLKVLQKALYSVDRMTYIQEQSGTALSLVHLSITKPHSVTGTGSSSPLLSVTHDHLYYPVCPDVLSLVDDPPSGNGCGSPNHI